MLELILNLPGWVIQDYNSFQKVSFGNHQLS